MLGGSKGIVTMRRTDCAGEWAGGGGGMGGGCVCLDLPHPPVGGSQLQIGALQIPLLQRVDCVG